MRARPFPRSAGGAHARDEALDMGDRRLRQNAVAEIEDMGAAGEALQHARRSPSSSARPPAISASGSRLPCSAKRAGSAAAAARGSTAVSRPIAASPSIAGELAELGRRAAREGDDRRRRAAAARSLGDDARDRRDAPALEFGRRQHARPGIEDLHRLGAGARSGARDRRPKRRPAGRSARANRSGWR